MKNDIRRIDNKTVEIKLTQGQWSLIDADDLDIIAPYRWCAAKSQHGTFYVTARNGKERLRLHRLVTGINDSQVDHINQNTLDNRKSNLRRASSVENQYNRSTQKNSTLKVKGVDWQSKIQKFRLRVSVDGVRKTYGYFDTLEEAKQYRDKILPTLHGEFANLK